MRNELGLLISNLEWGNMKYGERGFGNTCQIKINVPELFICKSGGVKKNIP